MAKMVSPTASSTTTAVSQQQQQQEQQQPQQQQQQQPQQVPKGHAWLNRLVLVKRVNHPTSYARGFRWFLTTMLAATAVIDPISYIMVYPALPEIALDLNTTQSVANLSSSLCLIGPALMPLYWGSYGERHGRRLTYLIAVALWTVFAGVAGAVDNISGFIVLRVLGSFCGCAVTVLGGAVVAEIWDTKERGFAMSIYYLGPLCGPAIGPILGGALAYGFSWRAIQWFQACYGGVVLIMLFCFLPETSRKANPVQTESSSKEASGEHEQQQQQQQQQPGKLQRFSRRVFAEVFGPLRFIALLRYPSIALVVVLTSIAFAAIVITATSIQSVFSKPPYEFNYLIVGLLYLGMPIGMVPGTLLSGKWADRVMDRVARSTAEKEEHGDHEGAGCGLVIHRPEDRLRENAWISTIVLPIALLFYGWTVNYGVFWFVPMIPWSLIGFSGGLISSLVMTVLTEFVPSRRALMMAVMLFVRNLLSAVGGSIMQPIVNGIGWGWFYTICAIVSLLNIAGVAVFRAKGRQMREHVDAVFGVQREAVKETPKPTATSTSTQPVK